MGLTDPSVLTALFPFFPFLLTGIGCVQFCRFGEASKAKGKSFR
jgi:hypothetical protein